MPAPKLHSRPPAWFRFDIGEFEATIVSDGPITLGSVTSEFPDAPKSEVRAILEEEFLPEDPMVLQQNALVLNTGKHLAVFDTGMGTSTMFGDRSGRILQNMIAAGIDPNDVDTVILTHGHPDHSWGLVREGGKRSFPNAQLILSKAEYDYWMDDQRFAETGDRAPPPVVINGARDSIAPYKDRMAFAESGKEALPGVTAISTPGHTPGHTSYVISSAGVNFINLGDVCHHYALLFPHPRWEYKYDVDPKLAVNSRLRTWDMATADKLSLIGFHFPYPGVGNIVRDGDGFRYVPKAMVMG